MFRLPFLLSFMAILSLLLAPAGFMPATDSDGAFEMRMCSGKTIAVGGVFPDRGNGTAPHDDRDDAVSSAICDYAMGGAAFLPSSPAIGSMSAIIGTITIVMRDPLTGIFPPKLPPSIGPPSF
ncbi:MAG: hypothetical protein WA908_06890 [Pontixanthobacter sp.]